MNYAPARAGAVEQITKVEPGYPALARAPERAQVEDLWPELLAGRLQVVSWSQDHERELVLGTCSSPSVGDEARRSRAASVAERVFLGESQKSVALNRGLAVSTVADVLRALLSEKRMPASASRTPLALVMLAHAAYRRGTGVLEARAERLDGGRVRVKVVGHERLLIGLVSPSQRDVAIQFLDGKSYLQIARQRGTSVRTVADQMSAVFRALGASGRYELLRAAMLCKP